MEEVVEIALPMFYAVADAASASVCVAPVMKFGTCPQACEARARTVCSSLICWGVVTATSTLQAG